MKKEKRESRMRKAVMSNTKYKIQNKKGLSESSDT